MWFFLFAIGRFSVSKEMSSTEVISSTPISMFLPAHSGFGRCALALNNFLITLHNDFIGRCKSLLKDESRYVRWFGILFIPNMSFAAIFLVNLSIATVK